MTERWIIAGRVQGVGFREWMVDAARRAGVRGHVRNLPDGTVEAVVAADRLDLLDALAASTELGPPGAVVRMLARGSWPDDDDVAPRFERR